jgi:hypothetical protein
MRIKLTINVAGVWGKNEAIIDHDAQSFHVFLRWDVVTIDLDTRIKLSFPVPEGEDRYRRFGGGYAQFVVHPPLGNFFKMTGEDRT